MNHMQIIVYTHIYLYIYIYKLIYHIMQSEMLMTLKASDAMAVVQYGVNYLGLVAESR